ncbi:MAG: hypothetical protein R6W86_11600 [Marinobacter sp.]|uniref:hypothetical protein n=1 Tax=Marinobacter sp. TaxID=50741 RepID=UPI00396D1EB1
MSVVEILIFTIVFIWFLAEPEWSIWRTKWFVNKVFVLAAFVLLLSTALFRPETPKARFYSASVDQGKTGPARDCLTGSKVITWLISSQIFILRIKRILIGVCLR